MTSVTLQSLKGCYAGFFLERTSIKHDDRKVSGSRLRSQTIVGMTLY